MSVFAKLRQIFFGICSDGRAVSRSVFAIRGSCGAPLGYSKGKRSLNAAAGIADWTLHDLRRTAATRMAELSVAPHVVEKLLNHATGTFGGVAGIYNRFEYQKEMREALAIWAAHLKKVSKAQPKTALRHAA